MTHEELRIAADTVLGIKKEYICEGDESRMELFKILSDKNLTPTARNTLKQRSEGKVHSYVKLFGTQHHYIPTKIKKGAGKGRYRLQKIKNKPKNSIDNLNWLS